MATTIISSTSVNPRRVLRAIIRASAFFTFDLSISSLHAISCSGENPASCAAHRVIGPNRAGPDGQFTSARHLHDGRISTVTADLQCLHVARGGLTFAAAVFLVERVLLEAVAQAPQGEP